MDRPLVNCLCGHQHPRKSSCPSCPCKYGTDNRKASLRAQRAAMDRQNKEG